MFVATLAAVLSAIPIAAAQEPFQVPADSAGAIDQVRDRQSDFERYRQSRIPVTPERSGGGCDANIGRMCIWFGGEGESDFPPEPPETERARRGLLGVLIETDAVHDDAWVTGQLVHYLVEQGDHAYAEQVARECAIDDTWWCSALMGYSLHDRGEFVAAEEEFRSALDAMPDEEWDRWVVPRHVLTRDAAEDFRRAGPTEQERLFELFWYLSDPLFLVEGNDRFTDHMARWVEVRNFENAGRPQQMSWEEDLEETLVRYGRIIGWSRSMGRPRGLRLGGNLLRDTRRVLGHHHPRSRGFIFPEEFLESPSDVPPESWITAPREARTWYAPPYAPDFRALETQVGRFRRGEEMLVVGAYQPGPAPDPSSGLVAPVDPFEPGGGELRAAHFLVPVDGGDPLVARAADRSGVFTMRAPPGRYVSSVEVFDESAARAWRARQGVRQNPLVQGVVELSDLMLLREGAEFPDSLDEALDDLRPNVRISNGESFTVVWEVYGLQVQEAPVVTIGFTQGRPGFLRRVGEFVGVLEPDNPVEVVFEDPGSEQVQSVFRAVRLQLPELEPGAYTLHLRLDLPGREPAINSRPIVVED